MLRRFVLTLVVLSLVGCAGGEDVVDVTEVASAEAPAEDAVLEDAGWPETAAWIHREVDEGRPVLMNILASWCVPCRRELPLLLDAADANPDIAFVGVAHQDQRDNAEEFVEEQGITFPTLFDIAGDVAYAIEARGMPTTAVFDTDGQLVATHTGELTTSSLEALLDEIR